MSSAFPEQEKAELPHEIDLNGFLTMRRLNTVLTKERFEPGHFSFSVPVKDCPGELSGDFMCRYPGCSRRRRDFCMKCKVPFCNVLDNGSTCHIKFHTLKELPTCEPISKKSSK